MFKDAIKNQIILMPEDKKYLGDVKVKIDYCNKKISARFEKNDDFIAIVKKLRYSWDYNNRRWYRNLSDINGDIKDRAAELCNNLLINGFSVNINNYESHIGNEEVKEKIINADYEQECTRWVLLRTSGDYKDWIAIHWHGKDENLYQRARSITKSRYDTPSVVVPIEMYDQVLDFAEVFNFKISKAAQKAIDDYEISIEKVRVSKKIPEKHIDKLQEILNSNDAIIEDLIDD